MTEAVCAFAGIVIVGRLGRPWDLSSPAALSVETFREDSDVDGLASATDMTTGSEPSEDLSISKSGRPEGAFAVCLVLAFRPGRCFLSDAMGRRFETCSAAIGAKIAVLYD